MKMVWHETKSSERNKGTRRLLVYCTRSTHHVIYAHWFLAVQHKQIGQKSFVLVWIRKYGAFFYATIIQVIELPLRKHCPPHKNTITQVREVQPPSLCITTWRTGIIS